MISIIIPCYNKQDYLEQCIDSVIMNETKLDLEIIIVDDCSTDNSVKIAEKYSVINGISLVKNIKNIKPSACRNLGIKQSSGEYIICLDADDMIPANYIQCNYENLVNNNVDVSYTNSQSFGISNKLYNWPPFDLELLKRSPFINCAAMFRKKVWERVGGYDESFIYGSEDYEFWLHAAKLGFKFMKCNETYIYYRIINNGITNEVNVKNADKVKKMLKEKHKGFYLEV